MIGLTLVCLGLIAFCAYREVSSRAERRELYQRLQAPTVAVAQHAREQGERKPARTIGVDDDEAWAELRRRRAEVNGGE